MPLFAYKAVREDGVTISNESTATDATDLRRELESKGYLVLSLEKKRLVSSGSRGSAKDFLIFNREFVALVSCQKGAERRNISTEKLTTRLANGLIDAGWWSKRKSSGRRKKIPKTIPVL